VGVGVGVCVALGVSNFYIHTHTQIISFTTANEEVEYYSFVYHYTMLTMLHGMKNIRRL